MNEINHLIVSNTLDFSTDFVAAEMKARNLKYLRINRDRFSKYEISYDTGILSVKMNGIMYTLTQTSLKSVFFRAPVFIRSNKPYSVEEQLYRSQWSSFIRNLTIFMNARWLNHPMYTYQAESKIYQLEVAKSVGLEIPKTIVTNSISNIQDETIYVVKALDTPLFHDNGYDSFTYSTIASGSSIKNSSLSEAPVIIQEYLSEKTDVRATIIGDKIFPIEILQNGQGITEDWRKTKKNQLQYSPISLPKETERKLLCLMKKLNLSFGGVDLIISHGKYYFIEVNPTGEWGWIEANTDYKLHNAIVDWMVN